MKIMATNNWSAADNKDANYFFSDDVLEDMENMILRDKLKSGYGFCDCEYADTEWTVTTVATLNDEVAVSLRSYYGEDVVVTYHKNTAVA
jgi:hypothetical protein